MTIIMVTLARLVKVALSGEGIYVCAAGLGAPSTVVAAARNKVTARWNIFPVHQHFLRPNG